MEVFGSLNGTFQKCSSHRKQRMTGKLMTTNYCNKLSWKSYGKEKTISGKPVKSNWSFYID